MNKIVYILLILLILYIIKRDFLNKDPENFENVSLNSFDDANSINILAQIAKNLMTGGTTIPGNLSIKDNLNVGGTGILTGKLTVNGGMDLTGPLNHNGSITTSDKLIANKGMDLNGNLNHKGIATISGATNITGATTIVGATSINDNLTVNGSLTVKKPTTDIVNVIYPIEWNMAKWTERMVSFYNKSEPDGTKREFLIIHPGNVDVNHPQRWIARMHGIKLGNQVLFFETGPRHEAIPDTFKNNSNNNDWRRNAP